MIANRDTLLRLAPIMGMTPHKLQSNDVSYGLGEAGYDIRIKEEIRFIKPTAWAHRPRPMQRFQLASAMEEFDMPMNLVGIVHDKSTWARRGLSVFNTVIEPGWRGFLTLELVYHGNIELIIPAGSGIAQVVFHMTSNEAEYQGRYQDQASGPVPAKNWDEK